MSLKRRLLRATAAFWAGVALFTGAAIRAGAQNPATTVHMTVGAGLLSQANGLGRRYGGDASLRLAPAIIAGVQIQPSGRWYGFRFDGVATVTGGYTYSPSADCQVWCTSGKSDQGRFLALTGSATAASRVAGIPIDLAVGAGFRRYAFPDNVCDCVPPPPGSDLQRVLFSNAWYNDGNAFTARLGFATGYRDGKTAVRFGIADYVSSNGTPGLRHDILVSLTLVLG